MQSPSALVSDPAVLTVAVVYNLHGGLVVVAEHRVDRVAQDEAELLVGLLQLIQRYLHFPGRRRHT